MGQRVNLDGRGRHFCRSNRERLENKTTKKGDIAGERRKSERVEKVGSVVLEENTAKTQYRKFETNIPRKGIAWSESQFPPSCF